VWVPFARPSLSDLITRIRADLYSRLANQGPLLRRAVANVVAPVWAGATHMLHGHLDWIALQLFPDTSEEVMLRRQAAMYGIFPSAAEFSAGPVLVAGDAGAIVPAGSILKSAAGQSYEVIAEVTLPTFDLRVKAVLAGKAGDLEPGETLSFETPIPGVESETTVDVPGLLGGEDEGDLESLRTRLLQRLQEPPEGGSDADYKAWALAVPGVTRVWVFPRENGLGTVVVRFVVDNESEIIPTAPKVAEVQAALDAERPTTAEVTALAPIPLLIPFDIRLTPDNSTTRAAALAELRDLMFREGAAGNGLGQGKILLSRMRTAIAAAGVTDYQLLSPVADVVPGLGQLPVVGAITWE